MYEPERTETFWTVVQAAVQAVTLGLVLTAAVAFVAATFDPLLLQFSRAALVIGWPITIALLVGWRLGVMRAFPISWPEQRIVVVGVGPLACELADALHVRGRWGYRVVGLIAPSEAELGEVCEAEDSPFPVLGTVAGLTDVITRHSIERVMVASPVAMREIVERLALADETDVRVDVVPELYEVFIGSVDSVVSDIPLMRITHEHAPAYVRTTKRAIDIVLALALVVVLSPVLLVAWLAVIVTMGLPAFFTQERVGREMKPFSVIKFRTMIRDAEATSGPVLATENDSRITAVGRVLRRYRIDELPQLVNIAFGEMSFVGPRPERAHFVARFVDEIPGYRERFKVKPGVTGLAQVSGSYATTPERKLKYDLIYMYHQNLLMDLQIMMETVRVVLTGRGAR